MDEFPKALYRFPGSDVTTDGGSFAYRMVANQAEQDAALADGWFLTTPEALASTPDNAPPTREELEQKATELGIKFDGRTSDRKLAEAIAAKMGG